MKQANYYVCEICGTPYKSEKQACSCEECHVGIERVERANYEMKGSLFAKYPKRITVRMNDGTYLDFSQVIK